LKFLTHVIMSEDVLCPNEGSRRATAPQPRASAVAIKRDASFLTVLLLLAAFASAQTLTGNLKNGTTNKPAAGDDVVLIKLAQGMEEAARTKTDVQGNFSFKLDDAASPHLIRAIHQGVTYHRMAPPGNTSVDLQVYDVSKKAEGINVTADLMYLQASKGELAIMRLFAVDNTSKPPRTQMNEHNFEFYLPSGAQIDSAQAQTSGGQAVNTAPVPEAEKGRYAFVFPLRPGTTQFQVTYHVPYDGKANLDPKTLYPLEHFVVILPQSIQFSSAQAGVYEEKQPPTPPGAVAEVAAKVKPGQDLAFAVSGNGMLQAENSSNEGDGSATVAPPQARGRDTRPGGGLGPPIDAPDPLQKYRWYILGGFAIVLAAGAVYIAGRSKHAAMDVPSDLAAPIAPVIAKAPSTGRSGLLLEALKEELFQLEVEHKQGRISQPEYEKAKAALDQTLERALARSAPK
jgi:hypothetical protein